jgi:sugar phosphate isomerase/epimerase
MTIPLSFHTGLLADIPTSDAVRMIRDHGYEMAELNAEILPWGEAHIHLTTPRSELAQLARLGPYSALCIHHRDFGSAESDRCDAATAWTVAMMDRAIDLGIDIVHVIPGSDADLSRLHDALARGVEAAESRNLTFALEPIVGRIIGTAAGAKAAIAAAPGLQVNFDPSHLHPMGDDVTEAARSLFPDIAHVHLKDATGKPDTFKFVPLGTGEIDLGAMVRVLVDKNYSGAVSIEHESHWFSGDDRPASQVLADCRNYFDSLLKEAQSTTTT